MVKNPSAFQPPSGMGRLLVKKYDFQDLDHDSKDGWTENGKPVDWSKRLTWTVYYVPSTSTSSNSVSMSAAEWHRLYGVNFPAGTDPTKTYNVKAVAPLIAVATQGRKQNREDSNQSFKEKHDALSATINSARTNITQLEAEKRELIRQGSVASDPEVKEVQTKIDEEQKRERDATDDMHPKIRQRVQAAPAPAATTPKPLAQQKATVYDPQGQPHFVDADKVRAFLADPKYKGWHQ